MNREREIETIHVSMTRGDLRMLADVVDFARSSFDEIVATRGLWERDEHLLDAQIKFWTLILGPGFLGKLLDNE